MEGEKETCKKNRGIATKQELKETSNIAFGHSDNTKSKWNGDYARYESEVFPMEVWI